MTSEQSPTNPPFQTPQPTELQSKETREAVLERVAEGQTAESDALDDDDADDAKEKPAAKDSALLLENVEGVENRHIPRIDSPPG